MVQIEEAELFNRAVLEEYFHWAEVGVH